MSVLVTGGAGFIGPHTFVFLLNNNYQIYVLVSFVNSSPISLERISGLVKEDINIDESLNVFNGDLRNQSDIKKVFEASIKRNNPIKAVIYFARLKAVGESNEIPLKYRGFNVLSTILLLKIMEEYNCFIIVFSSSATVYRTNKNRLISEKKKS